MTVGWCGRLLASFILKLYMPSKKCSITLINTRLVFSVRQTSWTGCTSEHVRFKCSNRDQSDCELVHFIAEVVVRVCGYELTSTVSPKWPFKELQLLGSQHWPEVEVWCKALTMLYKFTSQLWLGTPVQLLINTNPEYVNQMAATQCA